MIEAGHILVSLEARHADNIFSGQKLVELRRRKMNVIAGDTMWIYVKMPVGSIQGSAKITSVHNASPAQLWRRYGGVSGLSKREFFDYFEGVELGVALELGRPRRLKKFISLDHIRTLSSRFCPPQFFVHLHSEHPVRKAVADLRKLLPK